MGRWRHGRGSIPGFRAKVRIPLAGPSNRQGRIAATNVVAALAEAEGKTGPAPLTYRGAIGTSVVKIFDETAASTGFSWRLLKKPALMPRNDDSKGPPCHILPRRSGSAPYSGI
jgi:NADPH-dependent 2,4-dienoyl-CoA reductase/sulfur reductase-like enzyme